MREQKWSVLSPCREAPRCLAVPQGGPPFNVRVDSLGASIDRGTGKHFFSWTLVYRLSRYINSQVKTHGPSHINTRAQGSCRSPVAVLFSTAGSTPSASVHSLGLGVGAKSRVWKGIRRPHVKATAPAAKTSQLRRAMAAVTAATARGTTSASAALVVAWSTRGSRRRPGPSRRSWSVNRPRGPMASDSLRKPTFWKTQPARASAVEMPPSWAVTNRGGGVVALGRVLGQARHGGHADLPHQADAEADQASSPMMYDTAVSGVMAVRAPAPAMMQTPPATKKGA